MNKKLSSMYEKTNNLLGKVADEYNKKVEKDEEKTAYPLYIRTNKSYPQADFKLMVFGQETNGWSTSEEKIYGSNIDLEEMLDLYNDFFNEKYCYKIKSNFWPTVKKFIDDLQNKNKDVSIDYVWNNIVKMGYYWKVGSPSFYEEIIKPYLNNLVLKEIEILKPDYIVFFTGNKYDWIIDDIFNKPIKNKINGFKEEQFCEINIPKVKKCLRTYHPSYLNRAKIKEKVIKKITSIINEDIKKAHST